MDVVSRSEENTSYSRAYKHPIEQTNGHQIVPTKKRSLEGFDYSQVECDGSLYHNIEKPSKRRRISPTPTLDPEPNQSATSRGSFRNKRKLHERDEPINEDLHCLKFKSRRISTTRDLIQPARRYKHHDGMPSDEFLLRCRGYFADVDRPMTVQDIFEELMCFKTVDTQDITPPRGGRLKDKANRALYNSLIKKETNALKRVITDKAGSEEAERFSRQRKQATRFEPWGKLLEYGHWYPLVSSQEEIGQQSTAGRRRKAHMFGFWAAPGMYIPDRLAEETVDAIGDPETEFDVDATWYFTSECLPSSPVTGISPNVGFDITGSSYQCSDSNITESVIGTTQDWLGVLERSPGSAATHNPYTVIASTTAIPHLDDLEFSLQSHPQLITCNDERIEFFPGASIWHSYPWNAPSDFFYGADRELAPLLDASTYQECNFYSQLSRNEDSNYLAPGNILESPPHVVDLDYCFYWPSNTWMDSFSRGA